MRIKSIMKRALCVFLAMLMLFDLSGGALAAVIGERETEYASSDEVVIYGSDGEEIERDAEWDEVYPYGVFAFENSGLVMTEGEEGGVLKVYRLGGSVGRATAYISYVPAITESEDGEKIYDYALSGNDLVVEYEDALPVAQYQSVGKYPEPLETDAEVLLSSDAEGYVLGLSVEAESYQWQILSGGYWSSITDATGSTVPMDAEYIDSGEYDFRCVYTDAEGVKYCTDSYLGSEYVRPEEEVPEEMPEDIELNPEPTYLPLGLADEGEEPYAGWMFELTFAEGEWCKEIHFSALEDALPEAYESALITISSCYGGDILTSACQFTLTVEDNDESEPSTLGFAVSEVKVDKAEGYAELTIERVGGSQSPVTIEYATVDGSAKAGTDYLAAEGTLMFYSGIESMPLRIELIDDGIASDEELDFTVEISELLGDDNCSFSDATTATVKLWNSGTGEGDNLASVLYDAEAVDVSDNVVMNDSAASAEPEAVSGYQQAMEEPEELPCELVFGDSGELSTQSYYPNRAAIQFARASWNATESLGVSSSWWTTGRIQDSNNGTPAIEMFGPGETMSDLAYDEHTYTLGTNMVGLASKGAAYAELNSTGYSALGTTADTFGQMFSKADYSIRTYYGHDTSYYSGWFSYYYSYTLARFKWSQGGSSWSRPSCIERHGSGALNKDWDIAAGDTWDDANHNPFTGSYSQTFSYSGTVNFRMEMPYQGSNKHEKDVLLDNSAVILEKSNVTRRSFAANAFTIELSTPNDPNTAPAGCAQLNTDTYNYMKPSITVTKGGATSGNALYVGTQIKLSVGEAPAGYGISAVTVFKSTDNGSSWSQYDKFQISDDGDGNYYIHFVGTAGNPIAAADLNAKYKIRVSYERDTKVTIDLAPSVPRTADGAGVDTGKISYVSSSTKAYDGKSDHNFVYGAGANITYGYNSYSGNDFSTTLQQGSKAKTALSASGTELSFSAKNIQWINFNLNHEDLVLINGVAYPGDSKIYLSAADMAGELNVLYYHRDYQTAISAMKTTLRWVGLYFDANGNGKIDGYYDESTGLFVLQSVKGVSDEFCGYVEADDTINELAVQPVDGCQYFLKVSYNMTPRSLVVPEGENKDAKAQVLPAFITSINSDTPAYSRQTDEQKAYRYIVSGLTKQSKSAAETRSADGHLMYTAAATAPSIVDIPLGGDSAPAYIEVKNEGQADESRDYVWNPRFVGSMLYPFENPAPILITNSMAGPTQIVGDYTEGEDAQGNLIYTYNEDQLDRMNGYLASFTGNTTFALVTQQQKYTTEQIVANVTGVSLGGGKTDTSHDNDKYYVLAVEDDYGDYAVVPDSVTIGGFSTIPDSEYLKATTSNGAPDESGADMAEAGTGMDEFNVDFGINLGSNDIGITDYVTIILDGNRVGFAISVPLGGYEKALGSSGGAGEWNSPLAANKDAWTQFYDFFKESSRGDDSYKKAKEAHDAKYPKPTPTPAPGGGTPSPKPSPSAPSPVPGQSGQQGGTNPGTNGSTTPKTGQGSKISSSKSFSVDFSVSLAMLFEYDPLSNDYYFCMMSLSASVSASFRIEGRLTVFPLVYIYLQISIGLDISTGLGRVRDSKEEDKPVLDAVSGNITSTNTVTIRDKQILYHNSDGTYESTQPRTFSFETTYKSFNIRFDGKLAMQVYEKSGDSWEPTTDDDIVTGYLSSDGQKDVEVILRESDSMYLDGDKGSKTYKIVFTALDTNEESKTDKTVITRVARIVDTRDEVYFEGIELTPALAVEIGAGIGVELLKFEAYFVVSVDATITLALFNEEWLNDPLEPKYEGIGLENFNFSMSIGLRVVLLIFTFELNAATFWAGYDGATSDGIDGKGWDYQLSFLNDAFEVLDAGDDEYSGMTISLPGSLGETTKLYTLEDNLGEGLSTQAYDAADPYVPFQLSGYGKSVDAVKLGDNMLLGGDYKAVSAGGRDFVVYTLTRDAAAAEDKSYLVMSELVSATNSQNTGYVYGLANPADNSSTTPYIVLDTETAATGDLDFDVWVEENGGNYTVHAAWVSYAEPNPSEPTIPKVDVYSINGVEMDADNYGNADMVPTAPTVPAREKFVDVNSVEMTLENYTTVQAPTEPTVVEQPVVQTFATITETEYEALADEAKTGYVKVGDIYVLETEEEAYIAYQDAMSAYQTYLGEHAAWQTASELYNVWHTYFQSLAAYNTVKASYDLWYAYFLSLFSYDAFTQNRLANAAKNTVVKTAKWSFTAAATAAGEAAMSYTNDSSFSAPAVIGGDNGEGSANFVFAPASAANGEVVFYGSTQSLDNGTVKTAYESYIESVYGDYAADGYQNYMVKTKSSILDVYGTGSALNLAYKFGDEWKKAYIALADNQTLGNVEFTKLDDGNYYVAYTTSQETYVSYNVTQNGIATRETATDLLKTERLYLRRVSVGGDGTVTWGAPYLLRMTRDYEQDSGDDGVYSTTNATLTAAYDSPYFSNLGFLTANIDKDKLTGVEETFTTQAVAEHDFLIFEMNGSNYIILDDSLMSITDPAKGNKGTIYPFFTPAVGVDDEGNPVTESTTGKQEVTIGVDGKGNVFAVYVGAVQGTSNNALYLSAFDAATGTWGAGTMLAMNHMDTYEASFKNGWGQRTTAAAYLGLYGVEDGLLTQTDIANLYGSEYAEDIYATLSKANTDELGDPSQLSFSNIQALQGLNGELLVLTEGTLTQLQVTSSEVTAFEDTADEKTITTYNLRPTYTDESNKHVDSSIGFYAISYGKGEQALGQGSISFGNADFSVGSELYVEISAVNVGDTAFRGSEAQPITAKLMAAGKEIGTWTISQNVISGQAISLVGDCLALPNDLQNGDKFTLTLSEYTGAGYENGVTRSLDLFTVEYLPDLGVEDMEVSIDDISNNGAETTLKVSFMAANRGSEDSNDAYAQFSYASGVDANGDTVYSVLDISKNTLSVGEEEKLETQAVTGKEWNNGILFLGDISKGYGRRVTGTITVPSSVFAAGESEHLELKVELVDQSAAITGYSAGIVKARHEEYNTDNNLMTAVVEATTEFVTASSIVIAMGSTTLVPVSAVSSRGSAPVLTTLEVDDVDGKNIGIVNFKSTGSSAGTVSGVVSISPVSEGNGVIHVTDTDTNTTVAIAFTVVAASEGIDIYNDNSAFTFVNSNGNAYDPEGVDQSWKFTGMDSWGINDNAAVPMRKNVSIGDKSASFSFTTVAESLDFYFSGKIKVDCDREGFSAKEYTNNVGGKTSTKVSLGENDDFAPYTVTVTVLSDTATFDRLVETYGKGNQVPVPEYDGETPMLVWTRSLPGTASIDSKTSTGIALGFYAFDNKGISNIKVGGESYTVDSDKVSVQDEEKLCWKFDMGTITQNGSYDIVITDTSGNKFSTTLLVDWFIENVTGNTETVSAPENTAAFYEGDSMWDGQSVIGKNGLVYIVFDENQEESGARYSYTVERFTGDELSGINADSSAGNKFPIGANGVYLTTVTKTYSDGVETFTNKVLVMDKIDNTSPVVSMVLEGSALEWSAFKSGMISPIQTVTINGVTVNTASGRNLTGSLPLTASGEYTIVATDSAGNVSESVTIDAVFDVDASACDIDVTAATNVARNNGAISADLSKTIGGFYTAQSGSSYTTAYKAALVKGESDLTLLDGESWKDVSASAGWTVSYSNLADGTYYLAVKDANSDSERVDVVAIVVEDQSIHLSAKYEGGAIIWTAEKGGSSDVEINEVTVNGYKVNASNGSTLTDHFDLIASGEYVVVAKDTAGNVSNEVTVDAEMNVDLSQCSASSVAAKNQERNNGSISADLSKAIGGYYTDASDRANNSYVGSYEAALVKSRTNLSLLDETRWPWIAVENGSVSYSDMADGTYYLAVRDANDPTDTGRIGVMEIIVEDQSIHVKAAFENGAIVWTAVKGGTSDSAINAVSINGFAVEREEFSNAEGNGFAGSLTITTSGSYSVAVKDDEGNTSTVVVDASYALNADACSFVSNPVWDRDRNNGFVDIDIENMIGGYYSEEDSDEAAGVYYARYSVAIIPRYYDLAGIDSDSSVVWTELNKTAGWTHRFTDLVPGDYLVVIRDDVYDTETRQMVKGVSVEDETLVLSLVPIASSKWHMHDGQIIASVENGISTHFEVTKIYVDSANKQYTDPAIDFFLGKQPENLEWKVLATGDVPGSMGTVDEVATGYYVVAVRNLLGLDAADLAELDAKAAAYEAAEVAYLAALEDGNATEASLKALQKTMNEAKAAYEAACTEAQQASAAFYAANGSYWDGVVADWVFVETEVEPSNIRNIYVDENGSTVFELYSAANELTSSDRRVVASTVNNHDIVFTADGFSVYIAEDSLRSGFDVCKLFIDPAEAKDGMVIEYTDPEGNKRIIPWCLVEDGSVSYLSVGEGEYKLVPAEAYFSDIAGLWGEDNIYFTTYREMFNGMGEGMFGPKYSMTRAMFVTVLWRMAGSPEAEGGTDFTDLKADWYAEAVEWAVENNITQGYSAKVFAPNDNVTREQMCVFLCRFLDYLGLELPEGESIDFDDAEKISAWAAEQVDKCSAAGLVQGMGNNVFVPKNNATRMEVSTLLARFITQIVEKYCTE